MVVVTSPSTHETVAVSSDTWTLTTLTSHTTTWTWLSGNLTVVVNSPSTHETVTVTFVVIVTMSSDSHSHSDINDASDIDTGSENFTMYMKTCNWKSY